MLKHKNDDYRVPRREKFFRLMTLLALLVALGLFVESRRPAPTVPDDFVTVAEINQLTPIPCSYEALEQAIANGGDIYLDCTETINLLDTLIITQPTRIIGTSARPVILSGRNALQTVILVKTGARLEINHVEVLDSRRFGVYVERESVFKALNSRFAGHGSPTSDGAAVWNKNGRVFIDSSLFEDNQSADAAAALLNWDEGDMEVHESTFRNNRTGTGRSSIINNAGKLMMWNDVFETTGDSPFNIVKGQATIEDSVIRHDDTSTVITNQLIANLTLRHVTIETIFAPAIDNTGTLTLDDSTLTIAGYEQDFCINDGTLNDAAGACK